MPQRTGPYTTFEIVFGFAIIIALGSLAALLYAAWPLILMVAIGLAIAWWCLWSPHARAEQYRAEVDALYRQAKTLSEKAALPSGDDFSRAILMETSRRLDGLNPPYSGLEHFFSVPETLYRSEALSAEELLPPPENADPITLARYRDSLSERLIKLQEPALAELISGPITDSITALLEALPRGSLTTDEEISSVADGTLQTPPFFIPISNVLSHPGHAIEEMILPFYEGKLRNLGLFKELRAQFDRNLETAKQVMPSDQAGSADELIRLYLRNTPLKDLFLANTAFWFPEMQRLEHAVVVAGSGHGKTQTLEALFCQDIDSDDPPGMVVIDSKGDMIRRLAHLDVFNPDNGRLKDRLIVVDAHDTPSLNPFDIGVDATEASDPQAASRSIASMSYFFKALLGAELSGTMRVALYPFLHLMVRIPGATLQTLIDAMRDPTPYAGLIETLPEAPRGYLQNEYGRTRPETRNAVKDRIYDLRMMSPAFDAMFSAPRNCLDLPKALNEGKIVLVNLDRDFLEKEPSAILGKWFISQTHRAALRRGKIPEARRKPAYLIVDEAGAYFDEQTEDVLRTMRSYNVGALLAFQDFHQAPTSLQSAIYSSTSIRLAGGKSELDAKMLSGALKTTPEFILGQSKRDRAYSEFACYVDRVTPHAISLRIPHGVVDARPQMSKEQYERMCKANKAALTAQVPSKMQLNPEPKELEPWRLQKPAPKKEGPTRPTSKY